MNIKERKKRLVVFHKSKTSARGDISFGLEYWKALGIQNGTEKDRAVNVIFCDDYIIISKKLLADAEVQKIENNLIPVKFLEKTISFIKEIILKLNELVKSLESYKNDINSR